MAYKCRGCSGWITEIGDMAVPGKDCSCAFRRAIESAYKDGYEDCHLENTDEFPRNGAAAEAWANSKTKDEMEEE